MNQTKRQARVAGLLYLLASIAGAFGLAYVPGKLIVPDNATATADHIRASESLLRLGIGCELVGSIMFIFVVLALYRLFKPVNETHALTMMLLILVSIPVSLGSVVTEIAALVVASGPSFLSVFNKDQLDALAYLFMRLHGRTLLVSEIFWGLWLFPFAILVIRSRFIPSILGVLLITAAFGYLADSASFLFFPAYGPAVSNIATKLSFCEVPIIFWLLIWGARTPREQTGKALST